MKKLIAVVLLIVLLCPMIAATAETKSFSPSIVGVFLSPQYYDQILTDKNRLASGAFAVAYEISLKNKSLKLARKNVKNACPILVYTTQINANERGLGFLIRVKQNKYILAIYSLDGHMLYYETKPYEAEEVAAYCAGNASFVAKFSSEELDAAYETFVMLVDTMAGVKPKI